MKMYGFSKHFSLFLILFTAGCVGMLPLPALHRAAQEGDQQVVRSSLASGADPNHLDEYGFTPLMRAAMGGHVAPAQLLLDRGADPNMPFAWRIEKPEEASAQNGFTALFFAAQRGHVAVAELLFDRGANADAKDILR